jgi:predicted nucleic acid-binding protein
MIIAPTLASAVDLLEQQKASDSFVDTLVMAYTDHYGTRRIFGFDAVFSRNGYEIPNNPHARHTE